MLKNNTNIIPVIRLLQAALIALLLITSLACSTTKYIPDGQYLLESISLQSDSTKHLETELQSYIKQLPNDPKLGLKIYNMVDNDSNWFKKMIRKMGEAPVIYSPNQTTQSANELSIQLKNLGYLNGWATTSVDTAGKKAMVTYHIHEGAPYHIRDYHIDLTDSTMTRLANGSIRALMSMPGSTRLRPDSVNRPRRPRPRFLGGGAPQILKEGTIFSMEELEKERSRVLTVLRNNGYYSASLDNLHYLADTTLRTNQVDLTMILKDSTQNQLYRIGKVNVFSDYDRMNPNYQIVDSVQRRGINVYYDRLRFLRPTVITDKILIRPRSLYRERMGEMTYSQLQSLNAVSRVDIKYTPRQEQDSMLLDCDIFLTPGNIHSINVGVEGTNKESDFGVALNVTYGHQNIFNGSEILNLNLRGAYEFREASIGSGNSNYYEFRIVPSLTFPSFQFPYLNTYMKNRWISQTKYSIGLDVQRRAEFTREFFNLEWNFTWTGRDRSLTHSLSPLNVNFIYMPWKSDEFNNFLENNVDSLTKFSYNNIFTAGVSYQLIYTNSNRARLRTNLYTVRFNIETSGNLLQLISSSSGSSKNESGQYEVFGNPFAQYIKTDIDYSYLFYLDHKSSLACHAAVGAAIPYGNSSIMPFEKRYYAGGPNSVRGWRTRYLGPGAFGQSDERNITAHVGDINLLFNAEYRYKVMEWLEPAFFVDCGNIWTIKEYENQPGGQFKWDKFYKQLAVGTGIGLRFDFSFLIFRVDAGTKVYDPGKDSQRFVLFKENLWKNSAIYFAIGYPF